MPGHYGKHKTTFKTKTGKTVNFMSKKKPRKYKTTQAMIAGMRKKGTPEAVIRQAVKFREGKR